MGGTPMVTNYQRYYARRAARGLRWPLTRPTGARAMAHSHPDWAWSRFARSYRQRHPVLSQNTIDQSRRETGVDLRLSPSTV